jgi:hypothetical protein
MLSINQLNFQSDWNSTIINKPTNFQSDWFSKLGIDNLYVSGASTLL